MIITNFEKSISGNFNVGVKMSDVKMSEEKIANTLILFFFKFLTFLPGTISIAF